MVLPVDCSMHALASASQYMEMHCFDNGCPGRTRFFTPRGGDPGTARLTVKCMACHSSQQILESPNEIKGALPPRQSWKSEQRCTATD